NGVSNLKTLLFIGQHIIFKKIQLVILNLLAYIQRIAQDSNITRLDYGSRHTQSHTFGCAIIRMYRRGNPYRWQLTIIALLSGVILCRNTLKRRAPHGIRLKGNVLKPFSILILFV
ncbi:hypothetical protein ACJX0J_039830, partial [Zea mays]